MKTKITKKATKRRLDGPTECTMIKSNLRKAQWRLKQKDCLNYFMASILKQGRIHSPPVADGWAGAENRNVTDRPTDRLTNRPTRQVLESRVRD